MTAWIALGWAVTASSILGLSGSVAWMRLRSRRKSEPDESGRTLDFSLARYQPMARLLSDEDFLFLTKSPGYRPAMGQQWKRERRRVFRLYLGELAVDFNHLHEEARAVVAGADAQAAGLVGVLVKQKVAFWRAMAAIEIRLVLDTVGIGAVDPRPLLQLVDSMRLDLARLSGPQATAA